MISRKNSGGFTIVELMLFLAITAIMIVTLLAGWSVAINTQSYKDAARSLTSYIQGQYTNTLDVVNDRSPDYTCSLGASGVRVIHVTRGGDSRGTTDCLIMGRYITINGRDVRSNAIVGIEPTTAAPAGTADNEVIKAYLPARIDDAVMADDTYEIPWILNTYLPSATDLHMAIVIVRSPQTGTMYTFTQDIRRTGRDPAVDTVMTNGSAGRAVICLDPGLVVAQPRTAVVIGAAATASSFISVSADPARTGC